MFLSPLTVVVYRMYFVCDYFKNRAGALIVIDFMCMFILFYVNNQLFQLKLKKKHFHSIF